MSIRLTILLSFLFFNALSQDGSDIFYCTERKIGSHLVGSDIQVDFFRSSYRGGVTKVIDTVWIDVGNQRMQFIEHRSDTGYNNWFREQYLSATDSATFQETRISKFKVNRITKERIYVTAYVDDYETGEKKRSREIDMSFERKQITMLLVHKP